MGCDDTREDIEEKILYARLERDQIRRQRNLLIDQLRVCTGEEYQPEPIPDYIDIEYIKEQKRKKIEKKVKKAVKEEAIRQKEEEKRQKELEEEMKRLEKEGYDEEFLYQPLNLNVRKKMELDDIYNVNYVLQKKNENEKKEQDEYNGEELAESKDNQNKKKSNLKKSNKDKKVKFKDDLVENDEDNDDNNNDNNSRDNDENEDNNEIDNDIIQKVDARIATKTASINSVVGGGNSKKTLKNRISKNNSNIDNDSKSIPYFTPHLQPND